MRVFRHFRLHEEDGAAAAVYSVSLNPDGSLLATCGGDKLVRLWSTQLFQKDDDEPAKHLVQSLSKHVKVVTCCAWSSNGSWLASGSDDTQVLLWTNTGASWTRQATLRGHTMDVLDVAWGDDDKVLASCSIDNTVLIWDVETKSMTMTPKTTLRGHKNWVKGVAWDPTGRFLASAGEDRRVLVWRRDKNASSEFRVEADIRAPFEDVTAQTFFQRLSWAPDGRSLGVPNARKALQATACVLARGKWESVADLVGHRHPVTVVRFSPVLFHGEDDEDQPRSVVAIGGQDATVSVWTSARAKPLVVFRDCFGGAVSDLAWSRNGSLLCASSHDGSTCTFEFDVERDLGKRLSSSDARAHLDAAFAVEGGSNGLSLPNPAEITQKKDPPKKKRVAPAPVAAPRVNVLKAKKKRIQPTPVGAPLPAASPPVSPPRPRPVAAASVVAAAPPSDAVPPPADTTLLTASLKLDGRELHVQATIADGRAVIVASDQGQRRWRATAPAPAAALTAGFNRVVVGGADGSVRVLDAACGALLIPPLLVGAPPARLALHSQYVLCVSIDAGVRVWRVDESKAPDQRITNVARTSASPALRVAGGGDIVNASVDAKGVPSLGLACKGEALSRRGACVVCAYDSQADAWFEIADALSSSLPPSPEATGLLNEAAREAASRDATTAADLLAGDALSRDADALCACLEAKVLCAERLGSASDRDHWVSSYAACLAARGDRRRILSLNTRLGRADAERLLFPALAAEGKRHALLAELRETDRMED